MRAALARAWPSSLSLTSFCHLTSAPSNGCSCVQSIGGVASMNCHSFSKPSPPDAADGCGGSMEAPPRVTTGRSTVHPGIFWRIAACRPIVRAHPHAGQNLGHRLRHPHMHPHSHPYPHPLSHLHTYTPTQPTQPTPPHPPICTRTHTHTPAPCGRRERCVVGKQSQEARPIRALGREDSRVTSNACGNNRMDSFREMPILA